jgi:AcrR family transcriptional regulator
MKVQEKRRLKKIAIMEAALEVWGGEEYANTSLSLLARHLGMTKPALYRYFGSKEELLNAMSGYCSELMEEHMDLFLPRLKQGSPEEKVGAAAAALGDLIARQDRYIRFESYDTARRGELRWSHPPYSKLQKALNLPGPAFRLLMMYTHFFRSRQDYVDLIRKRNKAEIDALIPELFFNGLGGREFRLPDRVADISKEPGIDTFRKRLSRGTLMGAISELIREKGFDGVTLEGIASKAGLSKSSLYNYFRNKDEMLTKTSNGFVKEYIDFHAALLSRRESFEDKLTAHLSLQGMIFPQKPQAVLILRQLVRRDVMSRMERPLQRPGFLIFLEEGIRRDKLRDCLSPAEYQIIFSFFMVTEQLFRASGTDNSNELLDWLKLLACGYGAAVRQHDKAPSALS